MESPPPKKLKQNSITVSLGPLSTITHRELRQELNGIDHLHLSVESGSANSVFKVQSIELGSVISKENERSVRSASD